MALQDGIQRAAAILDQAQLLVVSSGAGASKESGIPTFRDALEGLWAQYDPESLATPAAFRRNPHLVWSWYIERRDRIMACQPNPGHYAVAELEQWVPQVVVLTQNIDGLHAAAGSTDVVELHGNIRRFKCFDDCRGEPTIIDLDAITWDRDHAPSCPYCGAYVRPDVVWFHELLSQKALERAHTLACQCDVMLVIGTSGVVQPAASLPFEAHAAGATVIEVNPEVSQITCVADLFLAGPSGEVLPQVTSALRQRRVARSHKGDRG
jgi:NAD-dependent deacetylase